MTGEITVRSFVPGETGAWQGFLTRPENATLFHDLDFLAYHPPERHRFHHLIVHQGSTILAVVPGGLVSTEMGVVWRSPLGASIGGPVLSGRPRLATMLRLIQAMQEHARQEGWSGLEITLPPVVYHPGVGELISFALFHEGFRERHKWLCPMIDLSGVASGDIATQLFERRQSDSLRSAVRAGAVATETGIDGLDDFSKVFSDTYARHGVAATHTISEIDHLMRRFPDRLHFVLTRQAGVVTAGILVMQLTAHVATTFYICSATEHMRANGPLVAIAALMETLVRRACRWLDLGPSSSDQRLNPGVMFFKEGLGAVGYSRSQWSWSSHPDP